jgi:hypothetical protein
VALTQVAFGVGRLVRVGFGVSIGAGVIVVPAVGLPTTGVGITVGGPALDKVALGLLDDHARHCIIGGKEDEQTDRTSELMGAVGRLMRRS